MRIYLAIVILCAGFRLWAQPDGFAGAQWGSAPAQVQKSPAAQGWNQAQPDGEFPQGAQISVFSSSSPVAGYPATLRWYFVNNRLFEVTVRFGFDNLVNFDFNYNVFGSVDSYYAAIRGQTATFTADIYRLLQKKYGKKRPVFKQLDPLTMFIPLDKLLNHDRWNFRYAPFEFYRKMIASGYARWDFPQTRVVFSLNMSAPEKRFDYWLSLSSVPIAAEIDSTVKAIRMKDL